MEERVRTGLGFALIFIILTTGGFFAWQYQKMKIVEMGVQTVKIEPVKKQENIDRDSLNKAVSATIEIVTNGAWDKKVLTSAIDSSQKAAKGFWWAKDKWGWIAWQREDGSWNVEVDRDGFDCSGLKSIPAEYKSFFGDMINQEGQASCYDWKDKASDWQTYRNEKLGFEMKIPKMVANDASKSVPISMVEKGSAVWLVADKEGSDYDEHLQQFTNSSTDLERVKGTSWAILVKKVNNDEELDQFIRDRYGKDCGLGEKKPALQEGMFDIAINAENTDKIGISEDPTVGCFLNWRLVIKYSPELHLAAAWDIGQDVSFVSSGQIDDASFKQFDLDMADSFKFIK